MDYRKAMLSALRGCGTGRFVPVGPAQDPAGRRAPVLACPRRALPDALSLQAIQTRHAWSGCRSCVLKPRSQPLGPTSPTR